MEAVGHSSKIKK